MTAFSQPAVALSAMLNYSLISMSGFQQFKFRVLVVTQAVIHVFYCGALVEGCGDFQKVHQCSVFLIVRRVFDYLRIGNHLTQIVRYV